VPVIREAQSKSLGQIVTILADLTDRARNQRLLPAEMSGSTFTISNLGMYGVENIQCHYKSPRIGHPGGGEDDGNPGRI